MKKSKSIVILILAIIILFAIVFASYKVIASQNDGSEVAKEKAKSEIKYLEGKVVELFNDMNGIQFENYKLSVTEIKETNQTSQSSSSSSSGSSSGSQGGDSSGGGEGSGSGSGSGGPGEESGGAGGDSTTGATKKGEKYILQQNGVLTGNQSVDWNAVKLEIEELYLSLPTITLDLYQTNVKQEDVLNMNTEVDNLTKAIKSESKEATLASLTKVYEVIRTFSESCIDDTLEKAVIKTKEYVLKSYSLLESNNWSAVVQYAKQAVDEFSGVITQNKIDEQKQFLVNKVYVQLNELQKAAEQQDAEIFLIKYKNLLEDLNNI